MAQAKPVLTNDDVAPELLASSIIIAHQARRDPAGARRLSRKHLPRKRRDGAERRCGSQEVREVIEERMPAEAPEQEAEPVTIEQLLAENSKLKGTNAALEAGRLAEATALVAIFDETAAENYVEIVLEDRRSNRLFLMAIQLKSGKTPYELRREAEVERDALAGEVATLREELKLADRLTGQTQRQIAATFAKNGEAWAERDGFKLAMETAIQERDELKLKLADANSPVGWGERK